MFLFSVYWPYKIWQRQEKDRQQQQQIQNFLKQSKPSSSPSLPSITVDNGDTCERATSPLRMLTPAKHSPPTPTPNKTFISVETTVIERSPTRNRNDQATPTITIRQNLNPNPNTGFINRNIFFREIIFFFFFKERSITIDKRPSSRMATPVIMNGNDRPSRRSYRVATSLNTSLNDETSSVASTLRGKTPLI
jgi:hypothetical protein